MSNIITITDAEFMGRVLGKMYVWHTSFEDLYELDYLGRKAKRRTSPGGEIRDWCAANEIPMIPDPSGQGFYLDPQDDLQRTAIKMRWA